MNGEYEFERLLGEEEEEKERNIHSKKNNHQKRWFSITFVWILLVLSMTLNLLQASINQQISWKAHADTREPHSFFGE